MTLWFLWKSRGCLIKNKFFSTDLQLIRDRIRNRVGSLCKG